MPSRVLLWHMSLLNRNPCTPSELCCALHAGGGTVLFVAPGRHEYVHSVEEREEAGTPNILGALRCGLAFSLRSALGAATIQRLSSSAIHALIAALQTSPNIVLLGSSAAAYHSSSRLPIISMLFKGPSQASSTPSSSAAAGAASSSKLKQGMLLHHSFVCKLLNDVYGIQARSGCSCAGSYAHQLLGVNKEASAVMAQLATSGEACVKGGWTRVSFSLSTDPTEVEYTAAALHQVGRGPV
jgi:selenocysteine lyase/cysteine desulfurase